MLDAGCWKLAGILHRTELNNKKEQTSNPEKYKIFDFIIFSSLPAGQAGILEFLLRQSRKKLGPSIKQPCIYLIFTINKLLPLLCNRVTIDDRSAKTFLVMKELAYYLENFCH